MGIKRPGGFAEKVAVPACAIVALPDGLDFHRAAVVMRHVPTAWNLLFHVANLKAGETVLIMGAGGNLGSIGIQIAKNVIGARVIATAGSDERVAVGKKLGADFGVNYNTHNLRDEVLRITDGKGVDVVYDNIANPQVLPLAFKAIGMHGRLVTAGAHAGPNVTIDFAHLYHKQITIRGRPGYTPSDLPDCLAAAAQGKVIPQIECVLPLSQAARSASHGRSQRGPGQDRARPDHGVIDLGLSVGLIICLDGSGGALPATAMASVLPAAALADRLYFHRLRHELMADRLEMTGNLGKRHVR